MKIEPQLLAATLDQSYANALVLAVTGYGQEEDKLRAFNAGFDHHLVKPVNLGELKSMLIERAKLHKRLQTC